MKFPFECNVRVGDPFQCKGLPLAYKPGQMHAVRLFGFIPLHYITVNVTEPVQVMVGGHSIGVFLHAQGVMVIGHAMVEDPAGRRYNPALEAGILAGDLILKVNGKPVHSDKQLRDEINYSGRNGKPVILEIKRKKHLLSIKINPVFCKETLRYRIGLFIRDSTAGIGTLSFYDPKTMYYGALGHMVTDVDTAKKIDLSEGKIVNVMVQGIYPGCRGKPGEKTGFSEGRLEFTGDIQKNTPFGIYGKLRDAPKNFFYHKPLPVAFTHEIKEGPAEVLTVLQRENIESFKIEIEKVNHQIRQDGKGLMIRVTDKELIRRTGGIIQGMSGSPIIQDGKFIGVITHVFVNDPTRGYGVPAEWMLLEAGFFINKIVIYGIFGNI